MKKQSATYHKKLAALVVAVFAFAGLGLQGMLCWPEVLRPRPKALSVYTAGSLRSSKRSFTGVSRRGSSRRQKPPKGFPGQDAREQEARTYRPCSGSGGRCARLRRPRAGTRRPSTTARTGARACGRTRPTSTSLATGWVIPAPRATLVFWDLNKLRKGMRSSSPTQTGPATPTRSSRRSDLTP